MAIDKKRLKLKEAGLPPAVYEQTPWYAKRMKVPVVKAKIGPKIMTLIAEERVFLQLPLKTEAKVVIRRPLHNRNQKRPRRNSSAA